MRPRLKQSIRLIEEPEGHLLLLRTGAEDIRIESPDHGERELLAALDGSHRLASLEARFGAGEVADTIARLEEFGLLEDAGEEEELPARTRERFDRQMRYLSDITTPGGPSPTRCQKRLAESTVAVFGAGGLGGPISLALATIGVGELRILDGDRVELSNLNRQIQFTEAEIGLLKAECLAARLRSFSTETRVVPVAERIEGQERLAEWIDGADLLVDAADWPAHLVEHWCNRACFAAGIPYIAMSHQPPIARVGPLYVPGLTGCYACQEAAWRRQYPLFDAVVESRRGRPSPGATLGPPCLTTAGLVATEILHYLTGVASPSTLGVAYLLDLRSTTFTTSEVVPEPGCPVCSPLLTGAGG
jgi:bacteriocin biosynthesis cyclodehydratase domain-containing protein